MLADPLELSSPAEVEVAVPGPDVGGASVLEGLGAVLVLALVVASSPPVESRPPIVEVEAEVELVDEDWGSAAVEPQAARTAYEAMGTREQP